MMVWLTVGVVAAVVMSAVALGVALRRRQHTVKLDAQEFIDRVRQVTEELRAERERSQPSVAQRVLEEIEKMRTGPPVVQRLPLTTDARLPGSSGPGSGAP